MCVCVWGGGQHRNNGAHLYLLYERGLTTQKWWLFFQPLPWSHTTLLLPICPWNLLSYCPSAESYDEYFVSQRVLCVGPVRECLAFQKPSISPGQNPHQFHSQKLWKLLFPTLELLTGEHSVGMEPTCSSGDTSAAKISLSILNCNRWVWEQPIFTSVTILYMSSSLYLLL